MGTPYQILSIVESRVLMASIPYLWKKIKNYSINWHIFDQIRIKGGVPEMQKWISRKVVELLGEEELTMTHFIFDKVCEHISAYSLYNELYEIVQEDTVAFTIKLYR